MGKGGEGREQQVGVGVTRSPHQESGGHAGTGAGTVGRGLRETLDLALQGRVDPSV